MSGSLKDQIRINMSRENRSNEPNDPSYVRRIAKARRALKPLRSSNWNGYAELTDQCMFGHALLCPSGKGDLIEFRGAFKGTKRDRKMEIINHVSFSDLYVGMNRTSESPSLLSSMLQCFTDEEVDKFYNEHLLITQLINKIKKDPSVRNRWIPVFAPPIKDIDEKLNSKAMFDRIQHCLPRLSKTYMRPTTLGQWFLGAVVNRIRQRLTKGIGLKNMFFSICWIINAIEKQDVLCLHSSATAILAWIESSTCDDCMLKTLSHTTNNSVFHYQFNDGDSFSDYITYKEGVIRIYFGPCGNTAGIAGIDRSISSHALITTGAHSLITSPTANSVIDISIRTDINESYSRYAMTPRQFYSLRSVLELHARVLRAMQWKQEARVYDAWAHERRLNLTSDNDDLTKVIVTDLTHIAKASPRLCTVTMTLSLLLLTGQISFAMSNAYSNEAIRFKSAHAFIIHYVFTRAPSPDDRALAESLLKEIHTNPHSIKRQLLGVVNTQPPHKVLKLTNDDVDVALKWDIDVEPSAEIDDYYAGIGIVVERTDIEDSPRGESQDDPSDSAILDKYMNDFAVPSTSKDLHATSFESENSSFSIWRNPQAETPHSPASSCETISNPSSSASNPSGTSEIVTRLDELSTQLSPVILATDEDGYITPSDSLSTVPTFRWNLEQDD